MNLWEQRFRATRLIAIALLATIPLYALVGEMAGPAQPGDYATFRLVLFVVSATVGLMGFQLRARMIPAAEDTLRRAPNDETAAQRWVAAHVVALGMAEVIGVCGLALRIVGGTLVESLPFYIIAMGLMLAWIPRRPE